MDTEALKIILELQRENVLLNRAVTDAVVVLKKRKMYAVAECGIDETSLLFAAIKEVLDELQAMYPRPTIDEQHQENINQLFPSEA